ncbi:hypothetical protein HK101_011629 [Irineochytrium annulatum]|nr:hypothetical protein HK101_011629 [Irineochytrium annulatum]
MWSINLLVAALVSSVVAVAAAPSPASFDILGQTIELSLKNGNNNRGHDGNNRGRDGHRGDRKDRDRDGRRGDRKNHRGDNNKSGRNVWEQLREKREFSRFVEMVEKDDSLRNELESEDRTMTVFAPTNAALKRWEEMEGEQFDFGRSGNKGDRVMRDIVRYHTINDEELERNDFFDGMLLETDLKLDTLDNDYQRIRVSTFLGQVYLNGQATVQTHDCMEADNGMIWPIDSVIMPPPAIREVMMLMPQRLTRTLAALELTGMDKWVNDRNGRNRDGRRNGRNGDRDLSKGDQEDFEPITMFCPDDNAWENLGHDNLRYLFSEAGVEDLKEILEYHIVEEVMYSTDLLRDARRESRNKLTLTTANDMEMSVTIHRRFMNDSDDEVDVDREDREDRDRRGDRDGRRGDKDRDGRRRGDRDGRRGDRDGRRGDRDGRKGGRDDDECYDDDEECWMKPSNYIMSLNRGESRIHFTDGVADNGVVHVISNVLIPRNVRLVNDRRRNMDA